MSPSVSARLLLTQSDARLVAFARAGHERAFEALVRRYRGPLLGYCRRLLLSEERAEDALQQALMQAWLALRAGTEVQNAKAWLYRIVHNSALNALRVSGYDYCTLSESLSGANAPQEDLDRRIAVREALAGLAALPEMQREALLRTAVEGSSHRETARELGVSEPALRGLVYRARAALRATAGAILPGPVVSWALGVGSGTPMAERVAEVGIGGGGAGVAGLLMKGGAMAVTAGMLAGGIAAVHVHPKPMGKHRASASSHRQTQGGTMQIALANARTASMTMPVLDVRGTPDTAGSLPSHRSTPRVKSVRGHRHRNQTPTGIVPAGAPTGPSPHGGGKDRRGSDDGGGSGGHDGPRNRGASGVGASAHGKGGDGGHDGEHRGPGGAGSEGGDGEGGSSGDATKGGSTGSGQEDGGSNNSGHDGQGEQSADTSGGGESHNDRGSSGTTSTTTTSVSPAGEQIPEGGKGD